MPLNFRDFLIQCQVSDEQIESMIAALYVKPPSVTAASSSPSYSPRLREITSDASSKALATQQNIIIEREIAVRILDFNKYEQVFGNIPENGKIQMENLAFLRAARFDIFKTGNCAVRASYVAFELYKLLGERASICIQSSPERDHYTLMIRKKEKGAPWYVYDAITNPELLFDLEEYQSNILPMYQKVPHSLRQYKLNLDAELYEKYQSVLPRVKNFFSDCAREIHVDSLMSDINFLMPSGFIEPESRMFTQRGIFSRGTEISGEKLNLVNQAIEAFKQDIAEASHITSHTL